MLEYNIYCTRDYLALNNDSMRAIMEIVDSGDADIIYFTEFFRNSAKVMKLVDLLKTRYSCEMDEHLDKVN